MVVRLRLRPTGRSQRRIYQLCLVVSLFFPAQIDIQTATRADLSCKFDASLKRVKIGSNIDFSMVLKNSGPADARGIIVTIRSEEQVDFVKLIPLSGASCTAPPPNGKGFVMCKLPRLPVGQSATVTMTVKPSDNYLIKIPLTLLFDIRSDTHGILTGCNSRDLRVIVER